MPLTGSISNINKLTNLQSNITAVTVVLNAEDKSDTGIKVVETLNFVSAEIDNFVKQPKLFSDYNISIIDNIDEKLTSENYIKKHQRQAWQMLPLLKTSIGFISQLKGSKKLTESLKKADLELSNFLSLMTSFSTATESTSRTQPNQLTSKQEQEFKAIIRNIKSFPKSLIASVNILLDADNTNLLHIHLETVIAQMFCLATEFDNLLAQANDQHKADFIRDLINHVALTDLKKANYLTDNKEQILYCVGHIYRAMEIIAQLKKEQQIEPILEIIQSTASALKELDTVLMNEQNIGIIENLHINDNQNNLSADNTTASTARNEIEKSSSSSLDTKIVPETQPNTLTATEIKKLNYISNNFRILAENFELVGQNLKAIGKKSLLFTLDNVNMLEKAVDNMRFLSELLDLLSKNQQQLDNPATETIKNIISNDLSKVLQNPEYFNTKKDETLNYLLYIKKSIKLFAKLKITATVDSDQQKYNISKLAQNIEDCVHFLRITLINDGYIDLTKEINPTVASSVTISTNILSASNPEQPVVNVSETTTADGAKAQDADNLKQSKLELKEISPPSIQGEFSRNIVTYNVYKDGTIEFVPANEIENSSPAASFEVLFETSDEVTSNVSITAIEIQEFRNINENIKLFMEYLNNFILNLPDTDKYQVLFDSKGNYLLEQARKNKVILHDLLTGISKSLEKNNTRAINIAKKLVNNPIYTDIKSADFFIDKQDKIVYFIDTIRGVLKPFLDYNKISMHCYSSKEGKQTYSFAKIVKDIRLDLDKLQNNLKAANIKKHHKEEAQVSAIDKLSSKNTMEIQKDKKTGKSVKSSLKQNNNSKQDPTKSKINTHKEKKDKKTQYNFQAEVESQQQLEKSPLKQNYQSKKDSKESKINKTKEKKDKKTQRSSQAEAEAQQQLAESITIIKNISAIFNSTEDQVTKIANLNSIITSSENSVESLVRDLTLQLYKLEESPLAATMLNLPATCDLNSKARQLEQGKTVEINSLIDMIAKFSLIENYFYAIEKSHELIKQIRVTDNLLTKIKPHCIEITNKLKQVIQKDQAVYKDIKLQLQALIKLCTLLTTEKNRKKYTVDEKIIDGCATIIHYFTETDKRTKAIRLNKTVAEVLDFLQNKLS